MDSPARSLVVKITAGTEAPERLSQAFHTEIGEQVERVLACSGHVWPRPELAVVRVEPCELAAHAL